MLHVLPPRSTASSSSAAWVKRAVKACANCRHDKVRCDDTRPCGGCRKKGLTAEQCVDGCEACRRARVRCEGGVPCARCMSLRLECADDPLPAKSPTALHLQDKPSERAKLACKNCRRDNKKCEDQRPCGRCVLRGDECIHVARGPKLVKVRCQFCREANRRCEDVRPCRYCAARGGECVDPPRKGKGHGTRVKAACVKCRQDKVRCDGQRPCVSCDRKGFVCQDRPSKQPAWSDAVTSSEFSPDGTPPRLAPEPDFILRKVDDVQVNAQTVHSEFGNLPPLHSLSAMLPVPYSHERPEASFMPLVYRQPALKPTYLPPLRSVTGTFDTQGVSPHANWPVHRM
ncbi:hypothetical protein BC834DRAFT_856998 [Gloeopeniophorella convolvens]|nr:hypothetical protein BC834DRAFT_856998 [Gloeopeniophorella convolvens]